MSQTKKSGKYRQFLSRIACAFAPYNINFLSFLCGSAVVSHKEKRPTQICPSKPTYIYQRIVLHKFGEIEKGVSLH